MKLLHKFETNRSFWFLLVTSFLFFLLRLPSFFEPYWYGDEGIYEVIGFGLRHGRLLYSGIWDNKPPLLYVVFALFSGDQGPTKFLSMLAGLGAVWAIFLLARRLFSKQISVFIATGIFAFLFALPLIEGNIANAENFMLLPNILAGLIIFSVATRKNPKEMIWLLAAGILLGISFLFKVVAMFDLAGFVVFLFIISLHKIRVKEIFEAVKRVIPFISGFLIPILLCAGFFAVHKIFGEFLHSTLFSNVSYVNYGNQFIIPQGFLILKALILSIVVIFFLIKRTSFSPKIIFLFLWLSFSIFDALFSQRPYTHYMLVLLPSFSLLLGFIAEDKKNRIIFGILAILLVVFVYRSFSFYDKTLGYYQNFLQYTFDGKSTTSYQAFFDHVTPRDYAIANFMFSHKNKTFFVWGNSGQIYKLTNTLPPGRFIVAYHMTMSKQNYLETQNVLDKKLPDFIIVLPKQDIPPISFAHYRENFRIGDATIYEYIY